MTKQEKIDAIYEAMADKTLSEGCIVFNKISGTNDVVGNVYITVDNKLIEPRFDGLIDKDEYIIIWHPVRIGDVFDFFDKIIFRVESEEALEMLPKYKLQVKSQIIEKWQNKRLPIDDQSEECIDFVYSLITK